MYDPIHAAELILRATGPQVGDQRRILYIAYLCDGWHRAIHGTPLIDGRLIAKDGGPVFEPILDTILDPRRGFNPRPHGPGFTSTQAEVVMHVIARYERHTTAELQSMVTAIGTPWHETYFLPTGRHATIDGEDVRRYFLSLAQAGRDTASRS
jgi:uncharacterized phage-associated protein